MAVTLKYEGSIRPEGKTALSVDLDFGLAFQAVGFVVPLTIYSATLLEIDVTQSPVVTTYLPKGYILLNTPDPVAAKLAAAAGGGGE